MGLALALMDAMSTTNWEELWPAFQSVLIGLGAGAAAVLKGEAISRGLTDLADKIASFQPVATPDDPSLPVPNLLPYTDPWNDEAGKKNKDWQDQLKKKKNYDLLDYYWPGHTEYGSVPDPNKPNNDDKDPFKKLARSLKAWASKLDELLGPARMLTEKLPYLEKGVLERAIATAAAIQGAAYTYDIAPDVLKLAVRFGLPELRRLMAMLGSVDGYRVGVGYELMSAKRIVYSMIYRINDMLRMLEKK